MAGEIEDAEERKQKIFISWESVLIMEAASIQKQVLMYMNGTGLKLPPIADALTVDVELVLLDLAQRGKPNEEN